MKDYLLSKYFKLFIKDEEGASAIEYALMAVMVALVIMTFGGDIGGKLTTIFTNIDSGLAAPSASAG